MEPEAGATVAPSITSLRSVSQDAELGHYQRLLLPASQYKKICFPFLLYLSLELQLRKQKNSDLVYSLKFKYVGKLPAMFPVDCGCTNCNRKLVGEDSLHLAHRRCSVCWYNCHKFRVTSTERVLWLLSPCLGIIYKFHCDLSSNLTQKQVLSSKSSVWTSAETPVFWHTLL
jgi:hypothetical protein